MKILAIDPGKMSGWATWYGDNFDAGMLEHMEMLEHADSAVHRFDLVVVESFIVTAQTLKKTRGENWSLEQIGAIRFFCHREEVDFKLQSPADAKSFVTNEGLKALGLYRPGAGHDNDAMRHVILALANHDRDAFLKLYREHNLI